MTAGLAEVSTAILAGGLGARLRPVLSDRPKVLAEVCGRPFLTYLLDKLAVSGIRSVVLCTGHAGEQVSSAMGEAYGAMRLFYSWEASPLGTAGALRRALPRFESDPVLVLNGDSFCDLKLPDFLRFHQERAAAGSVALVEMQDRSRYGGVLVETDGTIAGFAEKERNSGPGWINAGVYLLSQQLLCAIPVGRPASLEREMLPSWVGRDLFGYRSESRFVDIGTPEAYLSANRFFEAWREA